MKTALAFAAQIAARCDFPDPAGGTRRVLDDVSFRVSAGEFTAVVGPSGCGKSTLLNFAAGLLSPSVGEVRHQGDVAIREGRDDEFLLQSSETADHVRPRLKAMPGAIQGDLFDL